MWTSYLIYFKLVHAKYFERVHCISEISDQREPGIQEFEPCDVFDVVVVRSKTEQQNNRTIYYISEERSNGIKKFAMLAKRLK